MSITTGILTSTSTWTERCDQLKLLFESVSGLTLYSDTGTGNTRVLMFSLPGLGTNHLLKIYYSSVCYMLIIKLDGTSALSTVTGSFSGTGDWSYTIIANGNLMGVVLKSGSYTVSLLWSKCGTIIKTFVSGKFIHPSLDSMTTSLSGYQGYVTKLTTSGKCVLFPAFVPGESISVDISELPMENLYCFSNPGGLNAFSLVTINSVTYMVWDFNVSPSNHLVKCA